MLLEQITNIQVWRSSLQWYLYHNGSYIAVYTLFRHWLSCVQTLYARACFKCNQHCRKI